MAVPIDNDGGGGGVLPDDDDDDLILGPMGVPINSNQPAGTMDLSYWQSRGYTADQLFDENGQMRPGWRRTARGYEQTAVPSATTNPNPTTTYPSYPTTYGGGGGGSGFDGGGGGFDWPSYNAPGYLDPGEFDPGPAFTYKDFTAPTGQDMLQEPGFQFRMDQGRKALQASQFGKGAGLSGAAAKGIEEYGQNFASQEYGNVYNRAVNDYGINRNNAADIWGKQYGQRNDVYQARASNFGQHNTFNLGNANNDYAARRDAAMNEFNRWKASGDWLTQLGDE